MVPASDTTTFESDSDQELDKGTSGSKRQLSKFNGYLEACGNEPVQRMDKTDRSKRRHLQQARESVLAVLNTLAPHSVGQFRKALVSRSSGLEDENFEDPDISNSDRELMEALSECYMNANDWSTRRQMLSIMADKLKFKELKHFPPEVTLYRLNIAPKHQILHRRGAPIPVQRQARMAVDPKQVDHFITFITSPHIIQDVPFGEKIMKLSTGEPLYTPNVIRTMIKKVQ